MDPLEKILLLEIVNKQIGKLPCDNPEYYSTFENLTDSEKKEFYKLSPKIQQYWSYINLPKIIPEEI